ncbi:MAG: hypothetical protein ABS938_13680, partial [Psychrobacillus psychrodurans]
MKVKKGSELQSPSSYLSEQTQSLQASLDFFRWSGQIRHYNHARKHLVMAGEEIIFTIPFRHLEVFQFVEK